jgi:ubiquinol-cytochrome c reductase cytochrome c1 subunit
MPHVLWQLTGPNKLVSTAFDNHEKALAAAIAVKGLAKLEPAAGGKWQLQRVATDPDAPGTLSATEYQQWVADLVNFMEFIGEPTKNTRISLGIIVLLYLAVLFVLVYAPHGARAALVPLVVCGVAAHERDSRASQRPPERRAHRKDARPKENQR